jgi:APA family basic amino acid/polyamine antiporter
MVGGIIGVGILRNPGSVATILPEKWLILTAWTLSGLYVLLGVNSLAELATMLPKAGGPFNYVKRAFGNYAGFLTGWFDFISFCIPPAYISIAISEYLAILLPALKEYETVLALILLTAFSLLNLAGLRGGSLVQQMTSFIKVLIFVVLIICCFLFGGDHVRAAELNSGLNQAAMYGGLLLAFIGSMQLVLGTYDGWTGPAYFAEENTNPGKSIPRSLFSGALIVMLIYVLINVALFYLLPVSAIAGSELAVADAAKVIFGPIGYTILMLIAVFSLLGILNAIIMICPRILFGLSREGFFSKKGMLVNKGGTPYVALIITFMIQTVLAVAGSFEQLFTLATFMNMLIFVFMFSAVIKLRKLEPALPRPYKSWGYPWTTLLMVLISIGLFVSYTFADTSNFIIIIILIALSWPAFRFIKQNNSTDTEPHKD